MQHGSYYGCCVGSCLIVDFDRFEFWTLSTQLPLSDVITMLISKVA